MTTLKWCAMEAHIIYSKMGWRWKNGEGDKGYIPTVEELEDKIKNLALMLKHDDQSASSGRLWVERHDTPKPTYEVQVIDFIGEFNEKALQKSITNGMEKVDD